MSATDSSMVRPIRGGITMPNRMMAPPTSRMVRVWPTPQSTPISAAVPDRPLPAHDRGDRHDVVGVGGVAHPQEEAQDDDGEQSQHAEVPRSGHTDRTAFWMPALVSQIRRRAVADLQRGLVRARAAALERIRCRRPSG